MVAISRAFSMLSGTLDFPGCQDGLASKSSLAMTSPVRVPFASVVLNTGAFAQKSALTAGRAKALRVAAARKFLVVMASNSYLYGQKKSYFSTNSIDNVLPS